MPDDAAMVSANGRRPTAGDLRAAARDAYRASLAAGVLLSGAALGRQFDMSERWGRDRVAEVQRHDTTNRDNDDRRKPASRDADTAAGDEPAETREPEPTTRDDPAMAAPLPLVAPATDPVSRTAGPPVDADAGHHDALTGPGSWLDSVIILVVAGVAAAASYGHMLEVPMRASEPLWIARAPPPLSVDDVMLVASLNMLVRRWDNQPAGRLTWADLILGDRDPCRQCRRC